MTRTRALCMLLQHRPLRLVEIVEITGWGYHAARNVVRRCRAAGAVVDCNLAGWPYHVALQGADVQGAACS